MPRWLPRKLFEAAGLAERLIDDGDHLTIGIWTTAVAVPEIARTAKVISEQIAESNKRLVRV